MSNELEILKRRLQREINSRKQAEQILESKARELYQANQALLHLNSQLELKVEERTKALRASEIKYRSILENMELGLMEVDNSGIIRRVYDHFSRMTGYSATELVGCNAIEKLAVSGFEAIIEEQDKNRLKGQSAVYEVKIRKKNGEEIWVLISGAPFHNEEGEIIGSLGVHYDLTAQKELQYDLEAAKKSAIKAQQAEKQFLAGMSHEIRTPLNAIIGMSHLLKETKLDEVQSEYLELLFGSANILMHLISDILDISKIDAGAIDLQQKPFDLQSLGQKLIDTFKVKNQQKEVDFNFNFDSKINRMVKGDPQLLNQVLINLLGNADKFTSQGSVELKFQLSVENDLEYVVDFEVKDTGIGIKKERLAAIFEQFKQADTDTRNEFGGTGLGLTISQRLVNLMGGQLAVTSEIGVGSTFFFTLPFEKGTVINSNMGEPQKQIQQIIDFSPFNILVVEDNEVNLKYISALLKKWGLPFTIARNGQEGVQEYRNHSFDIIFMDLQMPVMTGFEATRLIRSENSKKSKLPIIALTASTFLSKKQMAMNEGMTDFLSKPFTPDQLFKIILKYLKLETRIIEKPLPTKGQGEPLKSSVLEELYDNDIEYAHLIFGTFLEIIQGEMQILKTQIQAQKWEGIRKQAHKMKPNFAMVGLAGFTQKLALLEEKTQEGEFASIQKIFHSLEDKLKIMLPQVQKQMKHFEQLLEGEKNLN